jgi:putative pyoverdin transport system ATP-binding/permease protein
MEFLRLLRSESDRTTINLVLMAVFSGVLSTLLIALIIGSARTVVPGQLNILDLAKFVLCLVFYIYGRRYVQIETDAFAERIVTKMRLRILDRIRRANLLRYEQVGTARIYSVLNESAATLSTSASYISTGFASAVMLSFATLYVAYLSLLAFVMTLAVIAGGILLFATTHTLLAQKLKMSSEKETEFLGLVQHLLGGIKEVKMNRARSDNLYDHVVKVAEEVRSLKLETDRQFAWRAAIGQNFLYVLLAFLIFILPAFSAASAQTIGPVATAIIFIMGPLGETVGSVPLLMRSNAAVIAINGLESMLDSSTREDIEVDTSVERRLRSFENILLRDVSFAYEHGLRNGAFRLGPLNLTIQVNELLFIIGGNGSGKSTMLKVMTGLYPIEGGSILLDGEIIRPEDLPAYRSLFSVIFTDFHLFDRLYGLGNVPLDAVEQLLREMRLQDVTGIDQDGRFKRIDLSTGQTKRLALIVALLEQRPVLVFDEVAADQDPDFRRYFYEVLLRRLQNEGKTIVAVTHDDHYFHVADRVLKMEDGKFAEYTR